MSIPSLTQSPPRKSGPPQRQMSAISCFTPSMICRSYAFGQLALEVLVEEFRHHAALNAVLGDHRLPILLYLRIFHPIRDRGAAFGNVHCRIVDVLFTRRAWLAPRIVRAEPREQAQRLLRNAKVLVIPARAAGRGRDHADRLGNRGFGLIL